jgi:ADP-dependent NAD(P)H-hydrate dehydratase
MKRALKIKTEGTTLITPSLLHRWPLPELDGELGKESRGKVLVVGGSEQIPGGAMLAAIGALRAGAGTLQIATSKGVAPSIAIAVPEARVIGLRHDRAGELAKGGERAIWKEAGECDALLVGPGMVAPGAGVALISHWLGSDSQATLIVDAAPLSAFCSDKRPRRKGARVIITPHAGEMASLCGIDRDEVLANPCEIARVVAARLGAVVALKGASTYVVAPNGAAFKNTAGNIGLGTSGSGDTLSGVIAGLCARGADPLQATVWGVYLHARAGDVLARRIGPLGFLARELLSEIPPLLATLRSAPRRRR